MNCSSQLAITYPNAMERLIDVCGTLTVGRDTANDIVLDEISISRWHAVLLIHREGVVLIDLESTNGTAINDKPTAPDEPVLLRDGDIITLGRVIARYRIDPSKAAIQEPVSE